MTTADGTPFLTTFFRKVSSSQVILVALVGATAAWILLTARLAVMSRTGLNHIENGVRGFLINHQILSPAWKHYQPPAWDLLQHFVFYAPFGIVAAIAIGIFARYPASLYRSVAEVAVLSLGFVVALYDEIQQDGLPDRRPGLDDLFSGWAGIAIAFAICWSISAAWAKLRKSSPGTSNFPSEL